MMRAGGCLRLPPALTQTNLVRRSIVDLNPFTKPTADDDILKAYNVQVEIRHDIGRREAVIVSYSMEGFRLAGPDLFDLLDRLPAEIASWWHRTMKIEVLVIPTYSPLKPTVRGVDGSFVVVPVRSIAAAMKAMEPKP
jgi:hypothetical protein